MPHVPTKYTGYFPVAANFTSYLETLGRDIQDGTCEITPEGVSLFRRTESDATTNDIRIQVRTVFVPAVSHFNYRSHPAKFMFSYQVTMTMDRHASPVNSSKLRTRHWNIRSADGVDQVNGPGVIGEYPEMTPGASFSYASCTFDPRIPITMDG